MALHKVAMHIKCCFLHQYKATNWLFLAQLAVEYLIDPHWMWKKCRFIQSPSSFSLKRLLLSWTCEVNPMDKGNIHMASQVIRFLHESFIARLYVCSDGSAVMPLIKRVVGSIPAQGFLPWVSSWFFTKFKAKLDCKLDWLVTPRII